MQMAEYFTARQHFQHYKEYLHTTILRGTITSNNGHELCGPSLLEQLLELLLNLLRSHIHDRPANKFALAGNAECGIARSWPH